MKTAVIIKPILTEKATGMAEKNVYVFEVGARATKDSVREVLRSLYKVTVSKVAILKRKGKEKRVGRRMKAKREKDQKIAYVTVTEGTINLFPKP